MRTIPLLGVAVPVLLVGCNAILGIQLGEGTTSSSGGSGGHASSSSAFSSSGTVSSSSASSSSASSASSSSSSGGGSILECGAAGTFCAAGQLCCVPAAHDCYSPTKPAS